MCMRELCAACIMNVCVCTGIQTERSLVKENNSGVWRKEKQSVMPVAEYYRPRNSVQAT